MQNMTFGDKEMMADALASQKFVTGNYNMFANECATKCIRDDVMTILNEEHQIQNELFTEMHNRGWYPTPAAEMQKITEAKQRFQNA